MIDAACEHEGPHRRRPPDLPVDGSPPAGERGLRRGRGGPRRPHRNRGRGRAAPRSRAAGRQPPRPRRLRRRGADHQRARRAGRRPHVQPRQLGLRAAGAPQRCPRIHPEGRALGRCAHRADPLEEHHPDGVRRTTSMSSLRAALIALFAASVAMAAVMVALVVSSDHESAKPLTAVIAPFIGLSFCGTGAFAWLRRPHNRFGALMTAVGFAWFLSGLTEANDPWVYTLGVYLGPLYMVLVGHMLLAFPSGRLETTQARTLIAIAYLTALAVQIPFFLLGGDITGDQNAPKNAWALADAPDSAQVFATVAQLVAAVLIVWLALQLFEKRKVASPPQRRAMAPVLWTGVVLMVTLAVGVVQQLFGATSPIIAGPSVVTLIAFAGLPWAFVVGLLRTRYSRAGAVGDLVERLNAQGTEGESL